MKGQIKVSRSELLNKLTAVGKVVSSKSISPDHDKFMFEVKNGELSITGADSGGNITSSVECECQFMEDDKFLIEHKIILDGLKALPEQPLQIDIDSGLAVFKHSNGVYDIPIHSADNFITLENKDSEPPNVIEMKSNVLVKSIKKVYLFAGNDELRPVFSSVFVECTNGKLSFTSTNTNIMALLEYEQTELPDFSLIIPIKIAKIVADLAYDCESVKIEIGTKIASFSFENTVITCRLPESKYPNFRSVIPNNNDKIIKADTREMISSIKRTSIFADRSSHLIELEITSDKLAVKSNDIDFKQSANEQIIIEYNSEGSLEIGFKSDFLISCLESIDTDNAEMSFSDSKRAALISPVEDEETTSSLTILIMPMMINV